MTILLLLAATVATPVASPDYAKLIDEAVVGGRLIQADAMMGLWRAASPAEEESQMAIAAAQIALAKGQSAEAEARFAAISERGSADCRVDEGLGIARARLGRGREAIVPLQRATASCAKRWRAWNALGAAYDAAGSWALSAAAYERAFQLTDQPAQILNNYGMSLTAQGRFAEAVAIFDKARERAPENPMVVVNGDAAYVLSGQDIQRRAGDDADGWAKRLADAGQVALKMGDGVKARAYFSRAMTISERYQPEAAAALARMEPVAR